MNRDIECGVELGRDALARLDTELAPLVEATVPKITQMSNEDNSDKDIDNAIKAARKP